MKKTKKSIKRNLKQISVGVSLAEYKRIDKARKKETNPSLSNFCRDVLARATTR